MNSAPHSLHHINIPMVDREKTKAWYAKVFGLKEVFPASNTKIMLMTRGHFDLHFTPFAKEKLPFLKPLHFAVEVEDWEGFRKHLEEIDVRATRTVARPQNNSKFCYIHDPAGNMIELTWHGAMHLDSSPLVD